MRAKDNLNKLQVLVEILNGDLKVLYMSRYDKFAAIRNFNQGPDYEIRFENLILNSNYKQTDFASSDPLIRDGS